MALYTNEQLDRLVSAEATDLFIKNYGRLPNQSDQNEMRAFAELVVFLREDIQYNRLTRMSPHDYQKKLFKLKTPLQAALAANRTGKSFSIGYAIACHLTGIYPDWWTDIKYNKGIKCVCAGASFKQIRSAIQDTLFGTEDKTQKHELGTGHIPRDNLVLESIVVGAEKTDIGQIRIRHISGVDSVVTMVSYEQRRDVLQGGKMDVIWFDEQPSDDEVVSELVRGIAQTPSGQEPRVYFSFTPLRGRTELVKNFLERKGGVYDFVKFTWDDLPTEMLDSDTRRTLMATFLPHEIPARCYGDPSLGQGAVFAVNYDDILYDPSEIKLGDHFKRICAIDPGRSPDPTAFVWCAWDPDNDITYVYDAHYAFNATPHEYVGAIQARGHRIPMAWPRDASKKGYTELTSLVEELQHTHGLSMLDKPFCNPDGDNGIDYGLQSMLGRMRLGKFKINKHLKHLIEEMQNYHTERIASGKIVYKGFDHGIDAMRYSTVSVQRFGISNEELSMMYEKRLQYIEDLRWIRSYENGFI